MENPLNFESIPALYVLDIAYPTSMLMTQLCNIIDPNIESQNHYGYTNARYRATIHHVLSDLASQLTDNLGFSDETFYLHLSRLPNMTMMQGISSLEIPDRQYQFLNAAKEWLLNVRQLARSRVPHADGYYEYTMAGVSNRTLTIAQWSAGYVQEAQWHDILN